MIYARLDKNEKPIYNPDQMDQIRYGFYEELSEDKINVYAQLNEKMVPKFEAFEMKQMKLFIVKADDKQVQQLKDSINEGLSFSQFDIFCKPDIPAEKMRIYRSLYGLGCNKNLIKHIVKHKNLDYDDLKKLKYILICANKLKEFNTQRGEYIPPFPCESVIDTETDLSDINVVYEKFANIILNSYYYTIKITNIDSESIGIIEECLKNNMDPEQIHFLVSSGYSMNEIKCISNILLEGMDFNIIKKMREDASGVLSAETIEVLFKTEIEEKDIEL